MKQVLRGMTIVAMTAFLAGCDEVKFDGVLNVNDQITFAQDLRAFTPEENYRGPATVVVAPGQFQAKAIIGKSGSKKQIKLEIKNADKPTVVKIQFDKNISLNGNFTLSASDIKQNFDVKGNMETQVERSQEYSRTEHCTYQYPQTVCRGGAKSATEEAASETLKADLSEFALAAEMGDKSPSVPNPTPVLHGHPGGHNPHQPYVNPPHQPVCHTVWVSRPGIQHVRYYYETTRRGIDAGFVQGDKTLANFNGKSTETRTVYTYQGQCF